MKRLAVSICVALITLLLLIPNMPSQAQSDLDAPYIYYYSDILNAFVIERADGSDSRVYPDRSIPNVLSAVGAVKWSPSGSWFSWRLGYREPDTEAARSKPFAVNVYSGQYLTSLDRFNSARITWARSADLLFVFENPNIAEYHDGEDVDSVFFIIDAQTDSPIVAFRTNAILDYSSCGWTVDDQHVVCYSRHYSDLARRESYLEFIILGVDGTVERFTEPKANIPDGFTLTDPYQPTMGDNGDLLYWNETASLVGVYDPITKQMQTYPLPEIDPSKILMWGLLSDTIVLSTREKFCPNCGIWLLDEATGEFGLIVSNPYSYQWSPDYQFLAILQTDGSFYLFDRATWTTHRLEIPSLVITESNRPTFRLAWTDNETLAVNIRRDVSQHTYSTYLVDVDTVAVDLLYPTQHGTPAISADGNFVVFYDSGSLNIFATHSDQVVSIPLHSGSSDAGIWYVQWHPTQNWFIRGEVWSGNSSVSFHTVMNVDGSIRRELGYCGYAGNCAGWLPTSVDVDRLPPPLSQPLFPEPYVSVRVANREIVQLSWSPDSQLIGILTLSSSTYFILDTTTQSIVQEGQHQGFIRGWEISTNGDYVPIFSDERPGDIHAVSPDGSLYVENDVMNAVTSEMVFDLPVGALTASFTPDGHYLAVSTTSSYIGHLQIWDTQTWELVIELPVYSRAVAFSPDGQTLAVGSSWDIQLWDVERLISGDN